MGDKYNRHSKYFVAVDCVIFGYEDGDLKLLLYHRGFEPAKGKWSLMGGFVGEEESSDTAARRILHNITGLDDIFLEQVQAFSEPKRDSEDRVVSITYYALIRIDQHNSDKVRENGAHWWSMKSLPHLVFDHQEMVMKALEKLQVKAEMELVGSELLPDKFTLLQLRRLYEAIFQIELDTGNFRKKVLSLKVLQRLDEKNTTESRRGAYYFKFIEGAKARPFDRIVKI
ncbi:NUDIX hydrolase [Plebeiibacterium sediminum]|uniref:NUDIX domain-containing protein n=1 Tax=Plebeiibacterium sediminum TaxID=2992112 RepID=A0AAE3SE44_9BACT|nr:NUDIX domain-containing protein [Plebeiobacterium sediminum]MCW3785597.1 NUDIX domain-containing protein [Plebeiobacterium sediminum]